MAKLHRIKAYLYNNVLTGDPYDLMARVAAERSLTIIQVTDVKTAGVNDLLTPGRNLRISGSRLKIAGDNHACGVAFINTDTVCYKTCNFARHNGKGIGV